ncbi:MAG TPA: methyltransferase domain-containing protein [Candidatus Deferrimicrobiaceae bacterium]
MQRDLLSILACPMCKTAPLGIETASQEELLACSGCGRKYRAEGPIPDLLPEGLGSDLSAAHAEWSRWSGKLRNFIQWRKQTWNGSAAADRFRSQVDEIKTAFVDFTGLRNSGRRILDVGCGSGIRSYLGSCAYVGVDPLLIEGHQYDFPVVRGVGEHLPFRDGSFDEAVLNQVLDHCNSIDGVLREAVRVAGPDGAVNVMQYTSEADGLLAGTYNMLIRVYLAIKGVRTLDTKMSRFDRKSIEAYFRERFRDVNVVRYSQTQIFIRARGWKENPQ